MRKRKRPGVAVALLMSICAIIVLVAIPLHGDARSLAGDALSRSTLKSDTKSASAHSTLRVDASWSAETAWMQRMIYLYASGNAPIQAAALDAGSRSGLTASQVQSVSKAVRAAWVQLMTADPASVGRVGVAPKPAAQRQVLNSLRAAVYAAAGPHYATFLTVTDATYTETTSPDWLAARGLGPATPATPTSPASGAAPNGPPNPGHWVLPYVGVYATSFSIPGRSDPYVSPPIGIGYVALPDAYLKFAELGQSGSIPDIYRPFYAATSSPPYTVDIYTGAGQTAAFRVPIADVGPWNEDDNWWDPTNTSTTLPGTCPVSTTLVSPNALTNAAVDGICPSTRNWRRIYYYLLYQHVALPFFQPSGYKPSGTFADTTAWPPVLPLNCPEASAASINNDGITCVSGLAGYNGNAGSWLRDGTYDSPVLNQSGIDLSPALNQALGWTWPSSGFIRVAVSRLP